jgi:hypothetical protein
MDIFNYRSVHNNLNRLPGQTHTGWTSMSGKHMAAVAGNVIIGRASKIEKIWNKYDNGQLKALSDRKVSTEALDPYRPDAGWEETKQAIENNCDDTDSSEASSEPVVDAPRPVAPEPLSPKKNDAIEAIAKMVTSEFATKQKIPQGMFESEIRELLPPVFKLAYDAIEDPEKLGKEKVVDEVKETLRLGFKAVDTKNTRWGIGSIASDWHFTGRLHKAYDKLIANLGLGTAADPDV